MNRILIINEYFHSCPYITQLTEYINMNTEFSADILDIRKVRVLYASGENLNLIQSGILSKLVNLPKLGKYFKLKYIKKFLSKGLNRYQVINIHFALVYYNHLLKIFKSFRGVKIISIWGSDFLRYSNLKRQMQKKLYSIMDYITFNNPEIKKLFLKYYKQFHSKTKIIKFGFQNLDYINKLKREDRIELRCQLKLNTSKKIVTIGYNGRSEQQHLLILDALKKMPFNVINQFFWLLPMTYLTKEKYIKEIQFRLDELNVDYKIINHFLPVEDICKVRIITDIVINAQITDSFSASLQEHLFAENIVIVGGWLPYKVLEDKGIFFLKFDTAIELVEVFLYAVNNLSELNRKIKNNSAAIYDISSWESNISNWYRLYSERA